MARSAAISSHPLAQEAAERVLTAKGGALQAALTGFFAAAGSEPGVLFAPMALLVGGVGSGVMAYDGRCRQPGKDAKRPRGFQADEIVPAPARAAVPSSVFAAAVSVAFQPGTTLLACVRPGVLVAKSEGASGRVELLEHVATLGGTALRETSIRSAFLQQFGPTEGGTMTASDLLVPEQLQVSARESASKYSLPWVQAQGSVSAGVEGIVAIDSHGLFVTLSFSPLPDWLQLTPFEVTVPSLASPVMRGVTRFPPGSVIESHHDQELERDEQGRITGAQVSLGTGTAPLRLRRDPSNLEVY